MPVIVRNELISGVQSAENLAVSRIQMASIAAGLGSGSVRSYVVGPDGKVIASIDVGQGSNPAAVLTILREAASGLKVKPGLPLVKPRGQSRPRQPVEPDSIILHVTTRYAVADSGFRRFPGEDWVVFPGRMASEILGAGDAWNLPASVSAAILKNFYPPMEDTSSEDRSRISVAQLKARVISKTPAILATIDGEIRMGRSFYPGRPDQNKIAATVTGYVEFSADRRRILRWKMATTQARMDGVAFTGGARLMPPSLFLEPR